MLNAKKKQNKQKNRKRSQRTTSIQRLINGVVRDAEQHLEVRKERNRNNNFKTPSGRGNLRKGWNQSSRGRSRISGHPGNPSLRSLIQKISSKGREGVPVVHQWSKGTSPEFKPGFEEKSTHDRTRIIGCEFLRTLEVSTTQAAGAASVSAGEVLFRTPFNPLNWKGTRLYNIALNFQTYNLNHIAFHYEPVGSALQGGSVLHGPSYDVDTDWTSIPPGDPLLRVGMSMEDWKMANVYTPVTTVWRDNGMDGMYIRPEDDDARLSVPGEYLIVSGSSYPPADGTSAVVTLANVFVTYDIDFYNRGVTIPSTIPTSDFLSFENSPMSNCFGASSGTAVNVNFQVAIIAGLASLAPYRNHDYVLCCTIDGSDLSVHPGCETSSGYIDFKTDGKTDTFNLVRGGTFYLFYVSEYDLEYFGMSTNLTAALERRPNIQWGETIPNITTTNFWWYFSFNPICIS